MKKVIEFVKNAISESPAGGEITVEDLQLKFLGISRGDLIQALRQVREAEFVTGRHHKSSRVTWGDKVPPSIQARADSAEPGLKARISCNGVVTEMELKPGKPLTIEIEA